MSIFKIVLHTLIITINMQNILFFLLFIEIYLFVANFVLQYDC
jgi:hypothetical protein